MHRFVLAALFLLPALAFATPVTLEGSYLTALEDAPEIVPSGYASVEAPSEILESCLVFFDLFVSPVGGTFLYETGQTYFHTFAGVTLDILGSAGDSLGTLSLKGTSTGIGATSFSLHESILVSAAPVAFDLFFQGRDAQIDWTITMDSSNSAGLLARSAPTVPEPLTVMTFAAGTGFLALRRKLASA
jgi:hypothetical protein